MRGGSAAFLLFLSVSTPALAAEPGALRVRVVTSAGPFTVELDRERAPRTVERFLARAASYEGLALCESRPHGFFVFGCSPDMPPLGMKPSAPAGEAPIPDGWRLFRMLSRCRLDNAAKPAKIFIKK